jgi:signal transduction histidine kinase
MKFPTFRPSLAGRLVLLALGWSLAALGIAAVVLALLFQQAALRRFDQTLAELTDNLLAGTTVEKGEVVAPALTDLRALRAYSGRYWEVAELTQEGALRAIVRSRSLWDFELRSPADMRAKLAAKPGQPVAYDTTGPLGEPLRALASQAELPGRERPVIFIAAEDRTPIDRDVRAFVTTTAVAFALLGAGLIGAVILQVRLGLRPVHDLIREVAEVRRGKAERLARQYPRELQPLAEELNALVSHNQEVVERQRTHVGNLAHALKTPISVMVTEAGQRPGPLADVVGAQAEAMRRQVDHHLRRARAAARTQGTGERTSVAEVLDELSRTLGRIFTEKGVAIDWDADEALFFQGERQDFLEIAGNALENACKFGRSRVRVRAVELGAERFQMTFDDDGPGLTEAQKAEMVRRGVRLDESAPGSGLGLSIIDELCRAYGGSFKLADSNLGGLRVEITLPRAEG